MTDQRDSLIVILGQQVKLAKGGPWPIASFISNGKCHRDCGFGEFTEFYDWVFATTAVPQLPYPRATEAKWLFHQEKATLKIVKTWPHQLRNRFKAARIAFGRL